MNIYIIGNGFVGKATSQFANCKILDKDKKLCHPNELEMNDLKDAHIVFICVPTPMSKNGEVYTHIVEDVVLQLKKVVSKECAIIIRSTVPPSTSDKLDVFFMPEFLTEKNFQEDFINNKHWIIGIPKSATKTQINNIENLINTSKNNNRIKYDSLIKLSNSEAEMVKYFRNSFLAVKVAYCNEIYQYCQTKNIDYDRMINTACLDDRITSSHTAVPGHDGRFGFGGTCFPKDCNGLLREIEQSGSKSYILKSALDRNDQIDRKDMDWKNDKGRAVV